MGGIILLLGDFSVIFCNSSMLWGMPHTYAQVGSAGPGEKVEMGRVWGVGPRRVGGTVVGVVMVKAHCIHV